jgi:ribonuclease HI|tara:strand:- start:8352 stop:8837 length:486 start_codon:yes stop_codon:yes gene_type:complete
METTLLTDGSVHPQSGIGFGAYLTFQGTLDTLDALSDRIKVRQFEDTSSTKLEIQTLLWALSEIPEREILSYTDSQNIVGLLSRKDRLTKNGYASKGGSLIRNHEIYREFFDTIEKLEIQFRLISGHKPSQSKDQIDKIFSMVDRASRSALRTHMKETSNN